jgi:putative phage-type endonuclease
MAALRSLPIPGESARDKWLRERRDGIGGSDAPAVMGLSKWKTPLDVFLDKRGEGSPVVENESMRWGTLLEPAIRQEYAERTGQVVRLEPNQLIRHPTLPHMFCTPDGITDSGRLYEGKVARSAEGWGEEGTDEIPEAYLIQVQHSLVVTKLSVADVAVLIGGSDFRVYEVPADAELQELIVEAEAAFWKMVQSGDPPAPKTAADAAKRFRTVRPGAEVTATQEIEQIVANLRDIRGKMIELEGLEDLQKALLLGFIGEAETLVDLHGKPLATWKQTKPATRFDAATFKADAPDLYAQYLKAGEATRRFLLK